MAKSKDSGKTWWAVIILVVIVVAVFFILRAPQQAEEEISTVDLGEDEVREEEEAPFDPSTYYENLESVCNDKEYKLVGCCIVSANIMKGREYRLADDGCPEGLEEKSLNCPGSYAWCEPTS